jgi:hypothetical protein
MLLDIELRRVPMAEMAISDKSERSGFETLFVSFDSLQFVKRLSRHSLTQQIPDTGFGFCPCTTKG